MHSLKHYVYIICVILGLQVLTVFFGSFIAGSLLNQIQSIVHNPTSLVHILGDAAPQVAVFFMTYLLLMVSLSLSLSAWQSAATASIAVLCLMCTYCNPLQCPFSYPFRQPDNPLPNPGTLQPIFQQPYLHHGRLDVPLTEHV